MIKLEEKEYQNVHLAYYGEALYFDIELNSKEYLGFDIMLLSASTNTKIYIICIDNNEKIALTLYKSHEVKNYLKFFPPDGHWHIILFGDLNSKSIFRVTASSDLALNVPGQDQFGSEFDGSVTYIELNVPDTQKILQLYFTSEIHSSNHLRLYDSDRQYVLSKSLTMKGEEHVYENKNPKQGVWLLCLIQDNEAILSISAVLKEPTGPPPTLPTGIVVEFIRPSRSQTVIFGGELQITPIIKGTIEVWVRVTDYHHSIREVIFFYKQGRNRTNMNYDSYSGYYKTTFNTRIMDDGITDFAAYAENSAGEIGIGTISIFIDNRNTFTTRSTDTEPEIVGLTSVASDASGNIKTIFMKEDLMYAKISIINYGGEGQTVISVNAFDSNNMPIGLALAKVSIQHGESSLQIGVPIPSWASVGTAEIYCNVFSNWPYEGGTPLIDEESLSIQIS
jgi:hypothetical protein